MSKKYTVWAGGGELNSRLLSKTEADSLAQEWRESGYDDVIIEELGEQECDECGNVHEDDLMEVK